MFHVLCFMIYATYYIIHSKGVKRLKNLKIIQARLETARACFVINPPLSNACVLSAPREKRPWQKIKRSK